MKVLFNLIILAMIAGGGYYFYEQNKDQLNETLDSVKNASVESVTEGIVEKVKTIDTDALIELAMDNKELVIKLMDENNIKLEDIDMEQLKNKLAENGIKLDSADLEDVAVKEKIKEVIDSAQKQ
jgi:hypothetical protein